jgi:hypothetical protein
MRTANNRGPIPVKSATVVLAAIAACSSVVALSQERRCFVPSVEASAGQTLKRQMVVINDGAACEMHVEFTGMRGAATSIAVNEQPKHGTLKVEGGSVYYTPDLGFSGEDMFDVSWFGVRWSVVGIPPDVRTQVSVAVREKINTETRIKTSALPPGARGDSAVEVAEIPARRVGDKWAYEETKDTQPARRKWSRTVTEILQTGGYVAVRGDRVPLTYDVAGNELDRRGEAYTEQSLHFPMTVGAKWTHDRKTSANSKEIPEKASWEVVAFERISVPAGTFDCFRVFGDIRWINGAEPGYARKTYWYCPSIRGVAAFDEIKQTWSGSAPVRTVSELVSFKEGP